MTQQRHNINLTPEQERLLSLTGKTPQETVEQRLAEISQQEVQDWWDSLTVPQKRAIYDANQ